MRKSGGHARAIDDVPSKKELAKKIAAPGDAE